MIAAEQNRQPMLPQFPIDRIVHCVIPSRHLSQIAIAVDLTSPGLAGR